MTNYEERFRKLLDRARPLQEEMAQISGELQGISMEMTIKIMTEAFPNAEVTIIRAVSEVKPSDLAKSATEAVSLLKENRIRPAHIIIDTARNIVTLGITAKLPPVDKKNR